MNRRCRRVARSKRGNRLTILKPFLGPDKTGGRGHLKKTVSNSVYTHVETHVPTEFYRVLTVFLSRVYLNSHVHSCSFVDYAFENI